MSRYFWMVSRHGRFMGFVTAENIWSAQFAATQQFGSGVIVTKAWEETKVSSASCR